MDGDLNTWDGDVLDYLARIADALEDIADVLAQSRVPPRRAVREAPRPETTPFQVVSTTHAAVPLPVIPYGVDEP